MLVIAYLGVYHNQIIVLVVEYTKLFFCSAGLFDLFAEHPIDFFCFRWTCPACLTNFAYTEFGLMYSKYS